MDSSPSGADEEVAFIFRFLLNVNEVSEDVFRFQVKTLKYDFIRSRNSPSRRCERSSIRGPEDLWVHSPQTGLCP